MNLNPFHENFLTSKRTRLNRSMRQLKKLAGDNIVVQFTGTKGGECARLCQKYGTDKGATSINTHDFGKVYGVNNYAPLYELLFAQKREHIRHVLECGIGTIPSMLNTDYRPGASLRMWREYFPNAQIVGLDIDADILFQEERIATYHCDQTDSQSIRAFLAKLSDFKFDVIIDDGLHKMHAAITLFENCIDRLADDGVYVIEDVRGSKMPEYAKYFNQVAQSIHWVVTPRIKANGKKPLARSGLMVITKPSYADISDVA